MRQKSIFLCASLAALVFTISCEKEVRRSQSSEATENALLNKTIRVEEPKITNSRPSGIAKNEEADLSQNIDCFAIPGITGSFSFFPADDHPCAKTTKEVDDGTYELADIAIWASAKDLGISNLTWLHRVSEPGNPVEEDPANYHVSFTPEGMTKTAVSFPIRMPAAIEKVDGELSFLDPYLYDARVASVDRIAEVDRLIIEGPDAREGANFSEIMTDGELVSGRLYQGDFNFDRITADDVVLSETASNTGKAIMLQQKDGKLIVFSEYTKLDSIELGKPNVRIRLTYKKI